MCVPIHASLRYINLPLIHFTDVPLGSVSSGPHPVVATTSMLEGRATMPKPRHLPPINGASAQRPHGAARSPNRAQHTGAAWEQRYDKHLHAQWEAIWRASPQGERVHRVIDKAAPSQDVYKLYRGLTRRQCSMLTQLRSGHVALNAYLARIKAVDSPLCPACLIPETPAHYIFTCRRYTTARDALRRAVGGPLSLRTTIGNVKARAAVLEYVKATGPIV